MIPSQLPLHQRRDEFFTSPRPHKRRRGVEDGGSQLQIENSMKSTRGYIPVSNDSWYKGQLRDDVPDHMGCYIKPDYVFSGSHKEGIPHGKGTYTYRDGSSLRAEFREGSISGQVSYISPKGELYNGKPIKDSNELLLLWRGRKISRLALWDSEEAKLDWIGGKFLEPVTPVLGSTSCQPYRFKPGTRILDITSEPGQYSELVEKIGFVFFKLIPQRLWISSAEVQEKIMVDLFASNFFVYAKPILEDCEQACEQMPEPNCFDGDSSHFLLLEKRTGEVVGSIFARFDGNDVEFESVNVKEDFRGAGLGSLLLNKTIRYLQNGQGRSKFYLMSSKEAVKWYGSFGFSTDSCVLDLDMSKTAQSTVFLKREKELPLRVFAKAMSNGRTDLVRKILPLLKNHTPFDQDLKNKYYKPNRHVIEQLNLSELKDLLNAFGGHFHQEILKSLAQTNDVKKQMDLLESWPEKEAAFPFLQVPHEIEQILDLYEEAESRHRGPLLAAAVENSTDTPYEVKRNFIRMIKKIEDIVLKLKDINEFLERMSSSIPFRISPSYVETGRTEYSPAFTCSPKDKNDIRDDPVANEIRQINQRLTSIETQLKEVSRVPPKRNIGPFKSLLHLKFIANSLLLRLKTFLPVIKAKPGVVFSYIDERGNSRILRKLGPNTFTEILPRN